MASIEYPRADVQAPILSARETSILKLMATGATARDVAHTLSLAEGTVKQYLMTIRSILDARNSLHAVTRAIALGIIPPEIALDDTEWTLDDDTPPPDPLTERETQILRLLRHHTRNPSQPQP